MSGESILCPTCERRLVWRGRINQSYAWHVWNSAVGPDTQVQLECRRCHTRVHSRDSRVFAQIVRCMSGKRGKRALAWVYGYPGGAQRIARRRVS